MPTKYASEMHVGRDYVFAPGSNFALDWDRLNELHPDDCQKLIAVTPKMIDLILVHLETFPKWQWIWGFPSPRKNWSVEQRQAWDDIGAFVSKTMECLMSGCDVGDLIKTQRMLVAAITGETVDLTSALPDNYTPTTALAPQFVADSGNGLADVTENLSDQQHADLENIKTALDDIATALGEIKAALETDPADLEDDLANVWNMLQSIATILGAIPGSPPVPL